MQKKKGALSLYAWLRRPRPPPAPKQRTCASRSSCCVHCVALATRCLKGTCGPGPSAQMCGCCKCRLICARPAARRARVRKSLKRTAKRPGTTRTCSHPAKGAAPPPASWNTCVGVHARSSARPAARAAGSTSSPRWWRTHAITCLIRACTAIASQASARVPGPSTFRRFLSARRSQIPSICHAAVPLNTTLAPRVHSCWACTTGLLELRHTTHLLCCLAPDLLNCASAAKHVGA